MDRQEFAYGRGFFYLRAFLLMILFTFALAFLAFGTVTPSDWVALIAALLAAYLFLVGLTPLLTKHVLLRSRMILRQGWYFRAVIPMEDAEAIGPWDGEAKYGLRITMRRILYVVGSPHNLVSVRLRTPRRFPQVLFMKAKEIVFDVDDRGKFLAAVEARVSEATPLPARKLPVLPPKRS